QAPVLFEVDAHALQARALPAYRAISRFPAVTRDVALVVPQAVPAQDLLDTFSRERQSNPLCGIAQVIVLFDEYKGTGLENHEKSLAFRFTLQDTQTTLSDNNVDVAMEAFVVATITRHGARLRT